jgi:hypothetical protein
MPETDMAASRRLRWPARVRDRVVLWLHRLADQYDWLPDGYGEAGVVDAADPGAVTAEWMRCLRSWAGYNPEEVFALKAGAALLLATLAGLWLLIALMR